MDVKEMVRDGKHVTLTHYRKGELWYRTECGFEFPVPISDAGDASFPARDRAMLFMRHIYRQIRILAMTRAAANAG